MKKVRGLALLLLCAAALRPQSTLDRLFDTLEAVRGFTEVTISPDGARVAWVQPATGIWIGGPTPRWIASGHGVAWAPDSRRLAFLTNSRLYTADAASGSPKQLAEFSGFVAAPQWSPDGKILAVLFIENAPRAAGPLQPVTIETGVIGRKIYNQRLALVDVESQKVRQLSPADLYVYEYDWSPDGRTFAVTAAPGPGDDNWYVAKLYTLDAQTGRLIPIAQPRMQIADPRWSPDGTKIAWIGGLMSDEGMTGGDVFVTPATGGQARDLTPGMNGSASGLDWSGVDRIVFSEHIDGESGIAAVSGGRVETLWKGPDVLAKNGWLPGLSLARDGKSSAAIRHSFQQPPEIWAGPIGAWRQVTHDNGAAKPAWGEATSLHWDADGLRIQGWLLAPPRVSPPQRYPLLVWVHGGPAGMAGSHWPSTRDFGTMLAAAGYYVLYPNPRGSYGAGEEFTRANVRDFGYGDLRDILAGVEAAVKAAPQIDPQRVGITGWSYGGYMSMWAVTQTGRFRAAVAGAGIANWQSYYGQNQIDQWMIPYFGASVYDDPAVYARSSPIDFIKKVKTPTLVLVGDRDAECPTPQSYEFWHALKTLGVDTELVVYAGEGHAIESAEHRRDIVRRAAGWFARYLQ